jgi:hypothetical protein
VSFGRSATLGAGLLFLVVAPAAGQKSEPRPRTRAERSGYTETSRHADVVAFLDSARARYPSLVVQSIGTTVEGRAIPVVIAARPRVASPAAARRLRRPVVYLNAGIHAGEVEGKEAVLALLRDLAADPRPNVLDSLVIVAVPTYNADGNEHVASQSVQRTEQNGPELVGRRTNAQGLDLNRDYIKAEAPETRAFLAAWRAWDLDVYVDLHTTNGSYHGYALTYSPPLNPSADPYARDSMLPAIRERIRARHGFETFDYGNFGGDEDAKALTDTAKSGWYTFDSRPRFGMIYAGVRGRIGLLSEAYSHDPLGRRVAATRAFVQEVLSYTAAQAAAIKARSRRADRPLPEGHAVSVRGALTTTPYVGPVLAEDLVATGDSSVTEPGVPPGIRRTGRFRTLRLPVYDRYLSALDRPVPEAYVIPAADTAAVRLLGLHGVAVDTVRHSRTATIEAFLVDSTWTAPTTFQGHRQRGVTGRWVRGRDTVAAGDYLVRTKQRGTALIVYLLEPESDDGLVTWNLFDGGIAAGRRFPVRRIVAKSITPP